VFDKNTFDLNPPVAVSNLSRPGTTGPREVQQYGESGYRRESSPVQKPGGGFATLDGPTPDPVEPFARPIPVGTKRRLGPPRTDK
jgi:hypothetical protein